MRLEGRLPFFCPRPSMNWSSGIAAIVMPATPPRAPSSTEMREMAALLCERSGPRRPTPTHSCAPLDMAARESAGLRDCVSAHAEDGELHERVEAVVVDVQRGGHAGFLQGFREQSRVVQQWIQRAHDQD